MKPCGDDYDDLMAIIKAQTLHEGLRQEEDHKVIEEERRPQREQREEERKNDTGASRSREETT